MKIIADQLQDNKYSCSYWCEFFGLTAYTTAILGFGLAVF